MSTAGLTDARERQPHGYLFLGPCLPILSSADQPLNVGVKRVHAGEIVGLTTWPSLESLVPPLELPALRSGCQPPFATLLNLSMLARWSSVRFVQFEVHG